LEAEILIVHQGQLFEHCTKTEQSWTSDFAPGAAAGELFGSWNVHPFRVAYYASPLCANMTSFTKPDVGRHRNAAVEKDRTTATCNIHGLCALVADYRHTDTMFAL